MFPLVFRRLACCTRRALRIYRRHEINALAWIALGVCLRSPALIAAISVALLIVCAWSLTRHIQYMKPLYELPVFSRLLAHSGMAFAAINAALLAVELATGPGAAHGSMLTAGLRRRGRRFFRTWPAPLS